MGSFVECLLQLSMPDAGAAAHGSQFARSAVFPVGAAGASVCGSCNCYSSSMTPCDRRHLKNNLTAFVALPLLAYAIARLLFSLFAG